MTDTNNDVIRAREVFARHQEIRLRGHDAYCQTVRVYENFYRGAGLMWDQVLKDQLESEGRPAREVNFIFRSINSLLGYQIQNRMDAGFLPKGGTADEESARVMSKMMKSCLDQTSYRWHETQVMSDGLIQRRGFFDMRMNYANNSMGDISIITRDPLDVLIDPDAKDYDPDEWTDVITNDWLTLRQIELEMGKDIADEVKAKARSNYQWDSSFGEEDGVHRNSFGDLPYGYGQWGSEYTDDARVTRYRMLTRQINEVQNTLVAQYPTGDVRIVEGASREQLASLIDMGVFVTKRRMRRVQYQVALPDVMIKDELSPYEHFTIIPYFPVFRRGKSIGMVDNAISPSETLNKAMSQIEHVINQTANSGWKVPENSLTNMTTEDLKIVGAQTSLVLEYDVNIGEPTKIEANRIPDGFAQLVQMCQNNLKTLLGQSDGMSVRDKMDMSGKAIQSLQYETQQENALQLDNLARTRHMLIKRGVKLIQKFMTTQRVIRITEQDSFGVQTSSPLVVNQEQYDGSILNDLTLGDYDIVITETPINASFDNSQFDQAMQMREKGVHIPDAYIIRKSSLSDKEEIAKATAAESDAVDPRIEAEAELKKAQARNHDAQAINKGVEGMFSAIRTAQTIVTMPGTSEIADALLRSAGFVDKDSAPIVPEYQAIEGIMPPPENTFPLTPDNPDVGLNAGLTATP